MTLASTLSIATFADLLNAAEVDFTLDFNEQLSGTGAGELLSSSRGAAYWRAKITTAPMANADAEALMALVYSRQGSMKTFLLYNKRLPYPSSDPDGSIFGSATPVVGTITDRLHVAFTGFPNGYSMPAGTFVQIIGDTSRYYVGQFAETKTANGSGAISSVEITPPLPEWVQSADAVTVKKPSGKFKLEPKSAYLTNVTLSHAALVLSARQTYDQ